MKITTNGVEIPCPDGRYDILCETDAAGETCPPVHLGIKGGRLTVLRSQLSSTGPLFVRIFAGDEVPFNDAVQGLVVQHTARAFPAETQPAPPVPGWKTTEWWYGLIATLASALVAGGVIFRSRADLLVAGLHCLVSVVFSVVAFGFAKHYTTQRTTLKREALLGKKVPHDSLY